VNGLFMGVVTNSSPWTYLGSHPVRPAPPGDFSSGLDLFALRRMRTLTTLAALGHMMQSRNEELPGGRDVVAAAALSELAFEAKRPIAFHIDGEYLGETEAVTLRFVPDALCVVALRHPGRFIETLFWYDVIRSLDLDGRPRVPAGTRAAHSDLDPLL
jgi:diacylglycerol kinase family enzyme